MTQDGLSFMEAVRMLAERAGVVLNVETDYAAEERNSLLAIHAELAAFYRRCLQQGPESEVAREYLVSRKLTDEIAERFGIGYAPLAQDALIRWGKKHAFTAETLVTAGILAPPNNPDRPDDYYDRFRGRLMFPICDPQGRVVAFSGRVLDPKSHPAKYVNSPETPIFQKSRILYALDKARAAIVRNPRREAIVCEGQIDVIRCHAGGFETAVASQGTAFTKEHVELLKRYADSVLLVFDGDAAGRKAALRTGGLFLEAGLPVRVAALPPGDDPDSLIRDRGPDAFRETLDAGVSLTAFQVRVLREEERDPDAVDAVNRISKAVFETLALCPQAVLRSHLLQEAADLLHLPPEAMQEDLDSMRQRLLSRPAPHESVHPSHAAGTHTAPAASRPVASDAQAVPGAETPISEVELRFCELLIHHGEEADVAALVDAHVPPDLLLTHPHAIAIHRAWRQSRGSDPEAFAKLTTNGDPGLRKLFARLVRGDARMEHARDATKQDAAEEMIARLWAQRLQNERLALQETQDPAKERRRLEITQLLKALLKPRKPEERANAVAAEVARVNHPEGVETVDC